MSVRTGLTIAVSSALLLASGSTFAADSGMYIGISLGQSRSNIDTAGALAAQGAPAGSAMTTDSSAFSFKEIFGYQVNQNFAAELSYTSLGKYDLTRTAPATAPVTGKLTAGGFGLAGVGMIPVNNDLAFFAKLGTMKADISYSAGTSGTSHNWVPNYGMGLKYVITPAISLRGELERFQGMGDNTRTAKMNSNLFTVGLSYKF